MSREPSVSELDPTPLEHAGSRALDAPLPDRQSAMTPRFNVFFRWFAKRFFGHFGLDHDAVMRLRELEASGSVIYVMRYSSRLDYFLFNKLFMSEGLRLSSFANGLRFFYYRPFWEVVRLALFRSRVRPHEVERSEDQEYARRLALGGQSFFLFLRTARLRSWLSARRAKRRQDELDLLQEVVKAVWDSERPVSIVPLSIFWRKGPRVESRFLNLSYGSLTRPSDLSKVTSFLLTYRDLSVKTGKPIDLTSFIEANRDDGPSRVARKVRRSILMYLYREEKVVEGPTLRAPHRVHETVLADSRVQAAIKERAEGKRSSNEKAWRDADKIVREIAASMNSTFLAVLGAIVGWIFSRMFSSIEVTGLDRTAEYAKEHPIVLAPSHRSYFDFLILSWLFYRNYMVPPHILARENMAFGPFGFIFRRVGAFFMRRSLEDPLYKEIFRSYVSYLVREGFTQEFFIEGGRSRTGKTLAPKMGFLAWDVQAFLDSTRRDLLFVPVNITYEQLVEESSMVGELEGQSKTEESLVGLVRARKYLRRRFGSVHLNFAEPLSLAKSMGEERRRFATSNDEAVVIAKRRFIDGFGHRIAQEINRAAVANASSVAAVVLMGSSHRGLLRDELVRRMQETLGLLRAQGMVLTSALAADEGEFRDSIAFLLQSNLVHAVEDHRGEILYFDESRRRALDIYRNSIAHYLAVPSFLARCLIAGATAKELHDDVFAWHELLYQEYMLAGGDPLDANCALLLEYFDAMGWIEADGERFVASEAGRGLLEFLVEQTRGVIEAYHVGCSALVNIDGEVTVKEFRKLAAEHFDRARLLGEAERGEAINDTTFTNLLDMLVQRGILTRASPEKKLKSEPVIAPGENWRALTELRERLAAALSTHP